MSRHGSQLPASQVNSPSPAVDRITVALVAKAAADLQITHERTRLSKTDIVNRALSLYEFIDAELSAGAELFVRRNGKEHIIKLLLRPGVRSSRPPAWRLGPSGLRDRVSRT